MLTVDYCPCSVGFSSRVLTVSLFCGDYGVIFGYFC